MVDLPWFFLLKTLLDPMSQMPVKLSLFAASVVDPDPYWIRIQELENTVPI